MNAGVCANQGARSSMEDVYRLVLWKKVSEAKRTKAGKNRLLEVQTSEGIKRSPKRVRMREESTSSDEDIEKECEKKSELEGFETKVSFFIVCDGHGGIEAAEFVNSHLFNKIISFPCFGTDPSAAILQAFAEVEEDFTKWAVETDLDGMVGTTVTAALIIGNSLFVANLGDSEAVVCSKGKATLLTERHSTNNPEESDRVEKMGGKIISDKNGDKRLGHPVWNPNYVNIAVTRAIGDLYFKRTEYVDQKQSGLVATPSVKRWELTQEDKFMLIASDGFWDVVTPDEAVQLVLQRIDMMDSNQICKELVEESKNRNSKDNITVLLVKFTV